MIPHFLVNGLLCILGTILLVIVGKIVFNLHFWGNLLIFLIAFLLSVICIFSIGFLIAAVAPNSRAANAIAYLVYFPMLFLSGATVPLQVMPPEIVAFSKLLPLTHCVEILQGTWLGNPLSDFIKAIVILLAISIVCIGVSIKAFRWGVNSIIGLVLKNSLYFKKIPWTHSFLSPTIHFLLGYLRSFYVLIVPKKYPFSRINKQTRR